MNSTFIFWNHNWDMQHGLVCLTVFNVRVYSHLCHHSAAQLLESRVASWYTFLPFLPCLFVLFWSSYSSPTESDFVLSFFFPLPPWWPNCYSCNFRVSCFRDLSLLLVASQLPILLIAPRNGEGEREYTSGRKAVMPQPWLRVIKVSLDMHPQPHHCVVLRECCVPL